MLPTYFCSSPSWVGGRDHLKSPKSDLAVQRSLFLVDGLPSCGACSDGRSDCRQTGEFKGLINSSPVKMRRTYLFVLQTHSLLSCVLTLGDCEQTVSKQGGSGGRGRGGATCNVDTDQVTSRLPISPWTLDDMPCRGTCRGNLGIDLILHIVNAVRVM